MMGRTPMQYVYDSFDVLIDICVNNGLPVQAQKLRDMRDGLPDDEGTE